MNTGPDGVRRFLDQNLPPVRDLVLVGGGHAHALVLRRWGKSALPGTRLTVVNPQPTAPYSGMLPGYVAGHYARETLDIDLVRLARLAGARLVLDRATGIDRAARQLQLENRPAIAYDTLSLDIGVISDLPQVEGFAEHGVAAKPLDRFATAWDGFLRRVDRGDLRPDVVVIGAGIAGAELALAMMHRLAAQGAPNPRITLLEAGDRAMRDLASGARRRIERAFDTFGIRVETGADVRAVAADGVRLGDGRQIKAGLVVSAAGARPQDWLVQTGLALENGYVAVGPDLRAVNDPDIFAVGDCAHLSHAPRPKAGVYAVREAPVLFDNLRAALSGGTARDYHPQSDYLKLVSLGSKRAIATKWGLSLSGGWTWAWKDRIDRAFMDQFAETPVMARNAPPALRARPHESDPPERSEPLCGGCGAKVPAAALASGLRGLDARSRGDVLTGPGDDCAIIRVGDTLQVLTTDHVRAFTLDPFMLGQIAAVHALGDVWAMGARPQAVLASLTVPDMSARLQAETVRELMAGAQEVVHAAGGVIVGGHTSVGAEMTAGFTVTGLLASEPVRQSGAKEGDLLILTKPLGTGTILAAEMRGLASGRDVAAAFQSMSRPLDQASLLLAPVAHAMTDVTGFGLAGHLLAMLDASDCAGEIDLFAVPLLDGALDLAERGVRSSLFGANAQSDARLSCPPGPRADLVFDPQTAGGLLAAVPPSSAAAVFEALLEAGERAAVIGTIRRGAPYLTMA